MFVPVVLAPVTLSFMSAAFLFAAVRQHREKPATTAPLTLEQLIAEACDKAVGRARSRYGIKLDYSLESILDVEKILTDMQRIYASTPQLLDEKSISFVFGAYIGETIRRNHPGASWVRESAGSDFSLEWQHVIHQPAEWCRQRLTGDRSSIWTRYEAMAHPPMRAFAAAAAC